MRPENVTVGEWATASSIAAGDRVRLARLVRAGTVRRVHGERNALTLPPRPETRNLAIRPKRRKR